MKQIKPGKKLVLDVHTVRSLEAPQLAQIAGGNQPAPISQLKRCTSATCTGV